MKGLATALAVFAIIGLSSCSTSSTSTTPTPPPAPQSLYALDLSNGHMYVYSLPATAASTPTVTVVTGFTNLYDAVFDSTGRLWIDSDVNPSTLYAYTLPLTNASTPAATVHTTGTNNAFSFTFDPTGNLWVADEGNGQLIGYHGPFSGTSTPASFTTITVNSPWNVIADTAGDLYTTANDHVARLNAPPTAINANLNLLNEPIAMVLDPSGNLYVGEFRTGPNGTAGSLYRYNSPINDAATPAIADPGANTTLHTPYYMALDNAGNLYVSDCSTSIKVFSTATFSATSAPLYTLPLPAGVCSTGLAVH
jgi:streptogramin lyase